MFTATYSPDDNKLRLYASGRLDAETYASAKAVGFRWAPKQDLFFASWSPGAEDLLIYLAGEVGDEDTTLAERAEERAERFEGYRKNRADDAEAARKAVNSIADRIPMGQPILVGHHSEKRARKDAEQIETGMRRAVKMWETASYWQDRAAGALRNAKYKELPSVRARRIKTLDTELRKVQRSAASASTSVKRWKLITEKPEAFKKNGEPTTALERAMFVANMDGYFSMAFPLVDFPRDPPASQYEGQMGLWSALEGGVIGPDQAQSMAISSLERSQASAQRWITHYENRLAYERAMLNEAGGTVADKTGPEKGGAVKCWASPGFGKGWSFVQKVNKVSVTVLDNHGNGGRTFTRTMPFDGLKAVMTAAQVAEAREQGRLRETTDGTGFFILDVAPETKPAEPDPVEQSKVVDAAPFDKMRAALKAGVKAVAVPQLFETPQALAQQVIEAADIKPGQRVLEPSAGLGALVDPLMDFVGIKLVAVEVNQDLAKRLSAQYPENDIRCADFLECNGDLGAFDRIVMNPPFADQADIRHVTKAAKFLKPGGRLVAIMSAGVQFRQDRLAREFREMVDACGGGIESLPEGAFKASGTGVNAVLVTLEG